MSLAESIKDTLEFERDTRVSGDLQMPVEAFQPVGELPRGLAEWAKGWSYCKPLGVFETVGVSRSPEEPVDLGVGFPFDQFNDLSRELRVARWNSSEQRWQEVLSQVYDLNRQGRTYETRRSGAAPGTPMAGIRKLEDGFCVFRFRFVLDAHDAGWAVSLSAGEDHKQIAAVWLLHKIDRHLPIDVRKRLLDDIRRGWLR